MNIGFCRATLLGRFHRFHLRLVNKSTNTNVKGTSYLCSHCKYTVIHCQRKFSLENLGRPTDHMLVRE